MAPLKTSAISRITGFFHFGRYGQNRRTDSKNSLERRSQFRSGRSNVNKVSTAVFAQIDLTDLNLSEQARLRIRALFARNVTDAGILFVKAQEFRTQEANRKAAFERLEKMIAHAMRPVVRRIATRPTRASVARRLKDKAVRSEIKRLRRTKDFE